MSDSTLNNANRTKVQDTTFGYYADATADKVDVDAYRPIFGEDFAIKENTGSACVLANITSPMGWPETVKFQIQDVANVYTNTGIDSVYYSPIKKGKSLLVSLQDTAKVTRDGVDVMYPIQAHFVLKYPVTSDITEANIKQVLSRMLGCVSDTNGEFALSKLIHGSLNPLQS